MYITHDNQVESLNPYWQSHVLSVKRMIKKHGYISSFHPQHCQKVQAVINMLQSSLICSNGYKSLIPAKKLLQAKPERFCDSTSSFARMEWTSIN